MFFLFICFYFTLKKNWEQWNVLQAQWGTWTEVPGLEMKDLIVRDVGEELS